MTATITCAYDVKQGGAALTALQAIVAAVPVPQDILSAYGLRVTSDTTSPGSGVVTRTIVFSMLPSSTATATATPDSDGRLHSMAVTAPGAHYVDPPIVSFGGPRNPAYQSPKARAGLKIVGAAVVSGGSGWSADAKAILVGSNPTNDPNFVPAELSLTIALGVITGVAIVAPGNHYTGVPEVVIEASSGSGAAISLSMGVSDFEIDYHGEGLGATASVVLTPYYKSLFPDGSDQGSPVGNLMTTAIAQAVLSPVVAHTPIVA